MATVAQFAKAGNKVILTWAQADSLSPTRRRAAARCADHEAHVPLFPIFPPRPAHSLAALALLLAVGSEAAPASAGSARELAPHRAVYDLKLHEAADRAGISAVDGRIVFDTAGSRCEGYTVTFRLVMRIFDSKGAVQITDLQTSSFETADTFDFTVRTYANGAATEDTRGRASREGSATVVELSKPARKRLEIGAVLFPTQHLNHVLAAARAGERLLQGDVYDGSEGGEQVFPTLAVIGGRLRNAQEAGGARDDTTSARGEDDPQAVAAIGEGASWPVTVSYHEPGSAMEETQPVYEISFVLHDNGVSRRLRLDYGDFSIDAGLVDIEFYEPPAPCAGE